MGDKKNSDIRSLPNSPTPAKAATREKLLAAAKQIFLATGYQGATLDAIAARAGFTKGAVYWHFPNKQSLFLALVAESISENLAELEGMLAELKGDTATVALDPRAIGSTASMRAKPCRSSESSWRSRPAAIPRSGRFTKI